MEIGTTKLSSKGQIVIPKEMRKNFKEGDNLLILEDSDCIIIKKPSSLSKTFLDDLAVAKDSDRLIEEFEKHPEKYKAFTKEEFFEEMDKW